MQCWKDGKQHTLHTWIIADQPIYQHNPTWKEQACVYGFHTDRKRELSKEIIIDETFFANSPRQASLSSLKEKQLTKMLSYVMTANYAITLLSLQNRSIDANADFADFADFEYPRIVSEIYCRGWNQMTPWNWWNCFTEEMSTFEALQFEVDQPLTNRGSSAWIASWI